MYFEAIELENIGPIDLLDLRFRVVDGLPIPTIIVGENGTGKTIVLSHLANFLLTARNKVFDDGEVERGRAYKMRSPRYIKSGRDFSYSCVTLQGGHKLVEWQLLHSKAAFEKLNGYSSIRNTWNMIPDHDNSMFHSDMEENQIASRQLVKDQSVLYFPTERYEEPAWLNTENLKSRPRFTERRHLVGISDRTAICVSPLKANRDWILDLLLDIYLYEIRTEEVLPTDVYAGRKLFVGYKGPSSDVYNSIIRVLRTILRSSANIRLGVGHRNSRKISVVKNESEWIPDLFHLSTGELQLLNLALSILRDYDLTGAKFTALEDVTGIVIIDEADSHLHVWHQRSVLPELISLFPRVQFIITSHAPLFLMGMEEKFGTSGVDIVRMPDGLQIDTSSFSEFSAVFDAIRTTSRFQEELSREVLRASKTIVLVEGDYDVRYIARAAVLLGREDLLSRVDVKFGDGCGNLDKIWKAFTGATAKILVCDLILIYDCDTQRSNQTLGKVHKRVIPTAAEHPISRGIENLFSSSTIDKVEKDFPHFIDLSPEIRTRTRGVELVQAAVKTVNKDEKKNLCDWLCVHGTREDFANFSDVFDIIASVLQGVTESDSV